MDAACLVRAKEPPLLWQDQAPWRGVPVRSSESGLRLLQMLEATDESPRKASLLVIGAPDRDVAELLESLENKASNQGNRFSGILVTPTSRDSGPSIDVANRYGEFAPLVFDGRVAAITATATNPAGLSIFTSSAATEELYRHYPYRVPLFGQEIMYYSEKQLRTNEEDR